MLTRHINFHSLSLLHPLHLTSLHSLLSIHSLEHERSYLKSTIPIPCCPAGALHLSIILWKSTRSLLLWAMVDTFSLLAPVTEQSRVCWLLFCGMKLPRSMWSSPGTWAITRNPRKVIPEPFKATAQRWRRISTHKSRAPMRNAPVSPSWCDGGFTNIDDYKGRTLGGT